MPRSTRRAVTGETASNRSAPAPRVTLGDIAAQAGVSAMTVSRALGNRGRIAEKTRRRVVQIAARLGYRPDPEVTKLMQHLRQQRQRRFQSVLVGLTSHRDFRSESYFRQLVSGAANQAGLRGYSFEVWRIPDSPAERSALPRMLVNRGIEGVLLLPQPAPLGLADLLPWERFSIVSTTPTVTAPLVHRVMPHHFANTLLLCRTLAARGFRRIGMVIAENRDRRVEHVFTAAVTWHARNEAERFIPPLVIPDLAEAPLRRWNDRERPDAIIVNEIASARRCERLLGKRRAADVRFALLSTAGFGPGDAFCGIDERPASIGGAAVDLLASFVERRARGLPEIPAYTLLPGCWRE